MPRLWPILLIFTLALAARALVWWQCRDEAEFHQLVGDSKRYAEWSADIAKGDWLSRREGVFYQAPLYPYFLSIHRVIFGESWMTAVRVSQVLLGSAAAVALYFAGLRFAGRAAGICAGVLLSLQPAAIFFDLQIDKASLDVVLMCAILLVIAQLTTKTGWRLIAVLGALIGVLTLNRENAIVLLAVALPFVWMIGKRAERWPVKIERWLFPLIVAAGFAVIVFPISLRNKLVGGEFHLVTCQFGPNFYIGNNATADGVYRPLRAGRGDPAFERTDATEIAQASLGRTLSPREVSRYWTHEAFTDIRTNPRAWLKLMTQKFAMTFGRLEVADNNDIYTLSTTSGALALGLRTLSFNIIAALAVGGVIASWSLRRELWPMWMIVGLFAATVMMFYIFGRYRHAMLPPLILSAAAGLAVFAKDDQTFPIVRVIIAIVTVFAVFVLTRIFDGAPLRARAAEPYNKAVSYDRRGNVQRALYYYHDALEIDPTLVEAHSNFGLLLAKQQKYDDAIKYLRTAVELKPNDAVAHNNLGMALGGKGDIAAAISEFERAVELDPSYSDARKNLNTARDMLNQKQ